MTKAIETKRIGPWGRLLRGGVLAWRDTFLPLALLMGGAWQAADAQGPAPSAAAGNQAKKHYLTKNTFSLPVIIDDRVRGGLKEVQLYFKDSDAKPWMLMDRGTPAQTSFGVKLEKDGEYWFTVVTVDKQGRFMPPDLSKEGPSVVVVQDTTAPQVDARPLPSAGDGINVRCEFKDNNLDPTKSRLEYQTQDKLFRPADAVQGQPDTFCIPSQAMFTGMVKVIGVDYAGNKAEREINIGATAPAAPAPSVGAVVPAPKDLVVVPDPGPAVTPPPVLPVPKVVVEQPPVLPSPPTVVPPGQETVTSSSPAAVDPFPAVKTGGLPPTLPSSVPPSVPLPVPQPAPAVKTAPQTLSSGANRHLLGQTHVSLEYKVEDLGPSGVGKIEAWVITEDNKTWRRLCEDTDRRSPIDLDLPGEGLFGVRLVASNGGGFGGNPPQPNDTPDYWIEVDKTKPSVELNTVRPSMDDTNELIITWKATDRNLGAEPIDLYYSSQRGGPWIPIAKNMKNDGRHRWTLPSDIGIQAFLRVVATDRVGNSNSAETPQAVTLDDRSRPRPQITGVVTPTAKTPTGN